MGSERMASERTRKKHTRSGNCWHRSVAFKNGDLIDVCPYHDEPRGDCSQCPGCSVCEAEEPADGE